MCDLKAVAKIQLLSTLIYPQYLKPQGLVLGSCLISKLAQKFRPDAQISVAAAQINLDQPRVGWKFFKCHESSLDPVNEDNPVRSGCEASLMFQPLLIRIPVAPSLFNVMTHRIFCDLKS